MTISSPEVRLLKSGEKVELKPRSERGRLWICPRLGCETAERTGWEDLDSSLPHDSLSGVIHNMRCRRCNYKQLVMLAGGG